ESQGRAVCGPARGGGRSACSHQARHRHDQAQRQRKAQGQLTQLADHGFPSCQRPLRFSASTTSGGMYFSSCLASTSLATKVPFPFMEPIATTPWPSRNKAGSTPLKFAGTLLLPSVTRK